MTKIKADLLSTPVDQERRNESQRRLMVKNGSLPESLVGERAKGLGPNVTAPLKAQGSDEYKK